MGVKSPQAGQMTRTLFKFGSSALRNRIWGLRYEDILSLTMMAVNLPCLLCRLPKDSVD